MKRKMDLDERGVPYAQSIEFSDDDIRQQRYSLLRLILLLPLGVLGLAAWAWLRDFGWHPMFPLAIGLAIPIAGGALLHFVPWLRLLYDAALTLAIAVTAFLYVLNLPGGDVVWASGTAFVIVLIGALITISDLRGGGSS